MDRGNVLPQTLGGVMDRGNVLPWTFVGVMDRGNVLPWRPWEVLWTEVIVTMDLGRCYGQR